MSGVGLVGRVRSARGLSRRLLLATSALTSVSIGIAHAAPAASLPSAVASELVSHLGPKLPASMTQPAKASAASVVLPTGGVVKAGTVTIGAPSSTLLTIDQSSKTGIIDWTSFSIGSGGTVDFNNGSGATLNRVTGGYISSIDGLLHATGSVYLLNPNGVIIGKGGVVDVGGSFLATTLNLNDADFLKGGDLTFSGNSTGSVVNYGKIGALGGDVALIASSVDNEGSITATQ